jgi:hypothetical protein
MVGADLYSTSYDEDDDINIPIVHATLSPAREVVASPTAPSYCYDDVSSSRSSSDASSVRHLIPMLPPGQESSEDTTTTSSEYVPLQVRQQQAQERQEYQGNASSEQARRRAAGIATGVIGFLVGGPMMAVVFGFSAAVATDSNGAAGDIARAVGDVAMLARMKAKEVDDKHHLVQRSRILASECIKKAKEVNQKHKVVKKVKGLITWTLAKFVRTTESKRAKPNAASIPATPE